MLVETFSPLTQSPMCLKRFSGCRRRSSWMLHTVSSVPENNNTLRLLSSASNRAVEVFL